jgi:hypothetical protein
MGEQMQNSGAMRGEIAELYLELIHVAPANAGTHATCVLVFGSGADAFLDHQSQGLWVPAFAGT